MISITVTGGPEAARKLRAYGDALRPSALMPALRAAALVVEADAKRRAPARTGNLRRSIHQEDVSGQLAVKVGTNVPYARRIELGFVGVDRLGRRYHQPPRPYLRPALENNRAKVVREFNEALRDVLRRVR